MSTLGTGVLFKHRFPKDRVLWNLGPSLEFIWAHVYDYNGYNGGDSFLLGMGVQTGFSFRIFRHLSLDINGLLKFPFGTVTMYPYSNPYSVDISHENLPSKSIWPFTGGIELGLTLWFPYRSRR